MEDWAEIRRLYSAEKLPIKEIVRRLGISRNTVRAALRSDRPPEYQRPASGSLVDRFEPQIRALLAEFPRMPSTVIAERVGWQHSSSIFRARVSELRPEYQGIDPVQRTSYRPGEIAQCDLWFPEMRVFVAPGQERVLPVLVMTLGFSRTILATMIPSRQAGDILEGMWSLMEQVGRVPKTLVWDREAAIGGTGKLTTPAAAFAGTLATRILLAPARDPEFKGMVERANGYLETSFLPGRQFASPADFNTQLTDWLVRANARRVRAIGARPVELVDTDRQGMLPMPRLAPQVGLRFRIRLARDYHVRVDGNDYSADPRHIGKNIDAVASATSVTITSSGTVIGRHERCWGGHQVITDPNHKDAAAQLRTAYYSHRQTSTRRHPDGHPVPIRALTDYDALFGVDFNPTPTITTEEAR